MTSSSVSSAAFLMERGTASEGRPKSDTTDDVFGMFLGRSLVQADQNSKENGSYGGQTQVTYDRERNKPSLEGITTSNTESKQKFKEAGQRISKKLDESSGKVEEASEKPDELQDSLSGYYEKVKDALTEHLEVTEEELLKAMEELGIGFASLTDMKNLTNLVMELTGTEDIGSLLLSEEFQNIFADVGELTQDLLTELGMTQEELEAVLQQMASETPEPETGNGMLQAEITDTTEPEIPVYQVRQEAVKEQEAVVVKEPETGSVRETGANDTVHREEDQAETDDNFRQDSSQKKNQFQQEDGQEQLKPQVTVQTTIRSDQTQAGTEVIQTVQQTYVDVEDIIRQVTEFTRVQLSQTESTIEMQLNPAHLGKLYLQVTAKDGVITAQLAAQNEAVKDALESQVAILKENMNQQGLKVEAVEVTIASHEFEQNLEGNSQSEAEQEQSQENQKRTRRNITLDSLDDLEGLMSEEESLAAKIMRDNGNSVDLNA